MPNPTERPLVFDIDSVYTLSPAEVVNELVDALGVRVTALMGDVTHTKYVRAWQAGEAEPKRLDDLITGLQATRAIVAGAGKATAQRWFVGCNSAFDLDSPVNMLRKHDADSRRRVLQAAIHFATR